ncbi:MAG: hypothetical protein B5766_05345 [Candidatus Lumbricidophila eiseniae]|uniref:Type II toxin-antitoxin system PemK/MazF family toxin n=1 Tax=Candidatus Lumbricidiphila eiseniae TaxID=1969409 RepID=A0A2A6FSC0_9MICO|nr:MAG: hypothetical protein B5766_05345 [Candidatus Lumbricidophila eiseniae]
MPRPSGDFPSTQKEITMGIAPLSPSLPLPNTVSANRAPTDRVPNRGDIWFVNSRSNKSDLGAHRSVGREIWSNKLAVVLSNDAMNTRSGVVQIVYLTTSENKQPSRIHVEVDVLPVPDAVGTTSTHALALCEQVHPVDQSRLSEFRGVVDANQLKNLEDAVIWSLGIEIEE